MIYLVQETYFGIHTQTIAVCNNENEVAIFLARHKPIGKLSIDKVIL